MQPFYEFEFQLFAAAGAPSDRIMKFSCGHVIPPNHILPIALTKGPSNQEYYLFSRLSIMSLDIYNFFTQGWISAGRSGVSY